MRKTMGSGRALRLASSDKTPGEIYSIILKGITCTLKSIFTNYYVSENIEALMQFINEKKIISAGEYKRLLSEARDFYPVIICALMIKSIRAATGNFKKKELNEEQKKGLFVELHKELLEFFSEWLCDIEINPLLYHRIALSYGKPFSMELCIRSQNFRDISGIEERVLRGQIIDIVASYMIEEVAVQLGLVGLDYVDYYINEAAQDSSQKQELYKLI